MDWAEEKYDVSVASSRWNQHAQAAVNHLLFFFGLQETSDRAGEDGPEGSVPLHPSAHVLGSLRPAGDHQRSLRLSEGCSGEC